MEIFLKAKGDTLSKEEILNAVKQSIQEWEKKIGHPIKKALLLPPDYTRLNSNAGYITCCYYKELKDRAIVDVMPALGTHEPVSKEQADEMFPDIPFEKLIPHNWRTDVVKVGEVPGDFISSITDGLWTTSVDVEVNWRIMDETYDLIVSPGQVVPHEVIGMANHSKNLFVGCGGKNMINSSHMIGAIYGMERMMGKDFTPVRLVFDYGLEHFLKDRPILWFLTVTTAPNDVMKTHGIFVGEGRKPLEAAIALAQEKNVTWVDKGIKKCVVYLDPKEFRSTWLGNKSVYRTRMAIADGGDLIVLAPGVTKFGEDMGVDALIRKYGYVGRLKVLELFKNNKDLQENQGVAAHLIHGSSDGRFNIHYAVKNITKEEVKGVNFDPLDYDEVIKKYDPTKLKFGYNIVDGEEIYYIPNPALGLWIDKSKF